MQPFLHDADELLVAELIIVILVKDPEDCVHQVVGQLDVCGHIDSTAKLLCERRKTVDQVTRRRVLFITDIFVTNINISISPNVTFK